MNAFDDDDIQAQPDIYADNSLSDERLIAAIAGGAVWALESLYQRYNRLFYSLTYHMVKDHQITEDLIQEAFISIWRRASSYSPQARPARVWLVSIMHHRTIDYLRAVRRRSVLKETPLDDAEFDEHTTFPDVWDEALRSVQGAQVRAALMQIPVEQRLVVGLAYFRGWTHTEIAEGCHIPLGTVKARMRLGMNRLKHVLEQMGFNEL